MTLGNTIAPNPACKNVHPEGVVAKLNRGKTSSKKYLIFRQVEGVEAAASGNIVFTKYPSRSERLEAGL